MPRPPRTPARSEIREEELADYDWVISTMQAAEGATFHPSASFDQYFRAWLASPPLAAAVRRLGGALMAQGGQQATYSPADHEFMDIVLSFDTGYWGLLALHAPQAVAEGVRLEAIEALRHGREEDLTADERQQVAFIREAVAGEVTNASWAFMEQRLGSARGVLEYIFFALFLQLHIRMHQAFAIPAISERDFDELLEALRAGTWQLPPSFADQMAGSAGTYEAIAKNA